MSQCKSDNTGSIHLSIPLGRGDEYVVPNAFFTLPIFNFTNAITIVLKGMSTMNVKLGFWVFFVLIC